MKQETQKNKKLNPQSAFVYFQWSLS